MCSHMLRVVQNTSQPFETDLKEHKLVSNWNQLVFIRLEPLVKFCQLHYWILIWNWFKQVDWYEVVWPILIWDNSCLSSLPVIPITVTAKSRPCGPLSPSSTIPTWLSTTTSTRTPSGTKLQPTECFSFLTNVCSLLTFFVLFFFWNA